ncbi:hypothetical protein K439DRAFT_1613022 [Ramaria rubella]|nr:hypothetical protein K439DRAFT_1613022 [Ramaria rubella]
MDEMEVDILQDLIENSVDTVGNHATCECLYILTFPAVSAAVDDTMHIQALPEPDEEDFAEVFAHVSSAPKKSKSKLPPIQEIGDIEMQPRGCAINTLDLDFSILIEHQSCHQTRHATLGVHTCAGIQSSPQNKSLRSGLIHEFHQVLREQKEQGVGTGIACAAQWIEGATSEQTTTTEVPPTLAGNSANAANSAANTVIKHHSQKFHQAGTPHADVLSTANVSEFHRLCYGDFGIVLWNDSAEGKVWSPG